MLFELLIALVLGILAGTITGIAPGIHVNLISAFLIASLPSLSFIQPLVLVIFIVAMAITHTFIDFIPSIYLGAPEEDTFLAVLPGHELLKQGKGHEAVVLTLYGSLASLAIVLILIVPSIYLIPIIEKKIHLIIPFILIFISFFMILREERLVTSLIVFILAGFLGFAAFNLPVKEPLLPILTGLFGASALITSIKTQVKLKKQKIPGLKKIKLEKNELKKSLFSSLIIAPFFSFLPALGSGYAALTSSELFSHSRKGFLFLTGAINTIVMALSFIIIYSIGKARTGAAAAVRDILQNASIINLTLIITAIIISGIFAFIIGVYVSKFFAKNITRINYSYISLAVIILLFFAVSAISNLIGILIFITATSLGIFAILSGVKRIHLMGSLLIPTILYYLF